jgi:hypothetical protein
LRSYFESLWGELRGLNLVGRTLEGLEGVRDGPNLTTLGVLTFACEFHRHDGDEGVPWQDEAAAPLARRPNFADGLELPIHSEGLSKKGLRRWRDRFGDGLVLFPDDGGRYRQAGAWASVRPERGTFAAEEPHPGRPPRP